MRLNFNKNIVMLNAHFHTVKIDMHPYIYAGCISETLMTLDALKAL